MTGFEPGDLVYAPAAVRSPSTRALEWDSSLDNPGVGRSSNPDAAYSIPMMAADAVALLDALGFACTDLLGISMGGRIALEIAAEHSNRVRKLVLVSTSVAGTGHCGCRYRCG